jgi:hypothetical protein
MLEKIENFAKAKVEEAILAATGGSEVGYSAV